MKAWSQELRFTPTRSAASPGSRAPTSCTPSGSSRPVTWWTTGVPASIPVYQRAATHRATNPSATFLADTQNNNAWAVFGDATYEFTSQWELDVGAALRRGLSARTRPTRRPRSLPAIRPHSPAKCASTPGAAAAQGHVRYKPADNLTIYGGWSRGFRSGGFNQTGVGAVARASGVLGVNDLFDAEMADTYEVGVKGQFLDHRLNLGLRPLSHPVPNGYFFVFLAANSTQNLGNLERHLQGSRGRAQRPRPTERLDLYASFGYTDSRITAMEDPTVIGNQAPLVSRTPSTLACNIVSRSAGWPERHRAARLSARSAALGGTRTTSPRAIRCHLVDVRLGLQARVDAHRLVEESHQHDLQRRILPWQDSCGGRLPRRYGVDFDYRF